jgi:hypothetical protein
LEKIEVIIADEVTEYFNNLIYTLFLKEYFSYEKSAEYYVQNIYNFIEFELYKNPFKKTPVPLQKFGSYYVFYRPNKRTTWYIFFEKSDNRVLITHITNSHLEDIRFLN